MNTHLKTLLASVGLAVAVTGHAGDATITKQEAKDLKTQSEGQYQARKKVAEANESLNKADCKVAADGSVERACEKSAKAAAKSDKADAKAIHEAEESAIKKAKP